MWDDLSVLPADDLASIINTYLQRSFELLQSVGQAARGGDMDALRRLLHQLRGSSAALGVLPLAERCAALEQRLNAGTITNIPAALRVLEVTHAQGAYALDKRRAALLERQQ